MSEDKPDSLADSRRNFMRKLGIALGGAAVTGAGITDIARGQGTIPSGYRFYRVFTADPYAPNGIVGSITPAVMCGSYNSIGSDPYSDVIYFHGTTTKTEPAIFRLYLDYSRTPPIDQGTALLAARGQAIPQIEGVPADQLPLVVGTLGTGSANSQGNYATSIAVEDTGGGSADGSVQLKSMPGVYLYNPAVKTWTKIARFGDDSPDGGKYGGIFGDVVLSDDNSVTLVAATTAPPAGTSLSVSSLRSSPHKENSGFAGSHAVIHVSAEPGESTVLLKTGDMLPGTTAMVESFGLIDVVKGEHFIAQVNARRSDLLNARPGTAVVQGRIGVVGGNRTDGLILHAASHHLLTESMLSSGMLVGESIIGPRIGAWGTAALVTHDPVLTADIGELDIHQLTTISDNSRDLIARAGDTRGRRAVAALGAPVVSSEVPLTYVAELLDDGSTQLIVSDGVIKKVILRSGDIVQGSSVTEINHGYHPAQVDVAGRLAFAAEFLRDPRGSPQDPNNILTSLVIGIPS